MFPFNVLPALSAVFGEATNLTATEVTSVSFKSAVFPSVQSACSSSFSETAK